MELGNLYNTVVEKNIPFFAGIEITTACNNKCVHCYNSGCDTLSLDVAKRCIDDAADLGTLFLSITGGEPLVHEDIWDILAYATEKNFATLMYTNAVLIGRQEALRLKEVGIYHVDTTLLGSVAKTHDDLTGVKGSFDKTMNAIRILRELDISMAVKTPIMKENADQVDEIGEKMRELGIDHIASPLIFAKDDGGQSPLCHRPNDEQLKQFFTTCGVQKLTEGSGKYSCHFGRCTFAVKANGDVNPCISVPFSLGNVKKDSLKNIWTRNAKLDGMREEAAKPLPDCIKCDIADWCFRCEGISLTEEGRLFASSDELCRMARIRKEAAGD